MGKVKLICLGSYDDKLDWTLLFYRTGSKRDKISPTEKKFVLLKLTAISFITVFALWKNHPQKSVLLGTNWFTRCSYVAFLCF